MNNVIKTLKNLLLMSTSEHTVSQVLYQNCSTSK